MRCSDFRTRLDSGEDSIEQRAHQRECTSCLEAAIMREPSAVFSTLGGDELLPPEGLDSFVSGVMNEVRLRETEKTLEVKDHPAKVAWWWAAAAAVFVMFATWLTVQPQSVTEPGSPSTAAVVAEASPAVAEASPAVDVAIAPSMTLPVVHDYDNAGATIVELPTDSIDDLKIVMIFDESLPQDL